MFGYLGRPNMEKRVIWDVQNLELRAVRLLSSERVNGCILLLFGGSNKRELGEDASLFSTLTVYLAGSVRSWCEPISSVYVGLRVLCHSVERERKQMYVFGALNPIFYGNIDY